jgi:hypothetical protein
VFLKIRNLKILDLDGKHDILAHFKHWLKNSYIILWKHWNSKTSLKLNSVNILGTMPAVVLISLQVEDFGLQQDKSSQSCKFLILGFICILFFQTDFYYYNYSLTFTHSQKLSV